MKDMASKMLIVAFTKEHNIRNCDDIININDFNLEFYENSHYVQNVNICIFKYLWIKLLILILKIRSQNK